MLRLLSGYQDPPGDQSSIGSRRSGSDRSSTSGSTGFSTPEPRPSVLMDTVERGAGMGSGFRGEPDSISFSSLEWDAAKTIIPDGFFSHFRVILEGINTLRLGMISTRFFRRIGERFVREDRWDRFYRPLMFGLIGAAEFRKVLMVLELLEIAIRAYDPEVTIEGLGKGSVAERVNAAMRAIFIHQINSPYIGSALLLTEYSYKKDGVDYKFFAPGRVTSNSSYLWGIAAILINLANGLFGPLQAGLKACFVGGDITADPIPPVDCKRIIYGVVKEWK
ncbi:MAG: hypothetical protein A3E87_06635 [Gammaproteobacteria bacterium RIFCSPHIGHO2_12_FULL_35_23]|nr:MAG: hypothetical protein A3E87_06635 [Gammaproteobacteria bacterium RIFCSPHIGHO2_12_FULL_35_23]